NSNTCSGRGTEFSPCNEVTVSNTLRRETKFPHTPCTKSCVAEKVCCLYPRTKIFRIFLMSSVKSAFPLDQAKREKPVRGGFSLSELPPPMIKFTCSAKLNSSLVSEYFRYISN